MRTNRLRHCKEKKLRNETSERSKWENTTTIALGHSMSHAAIRFVRSDVFNFQSNFHPNLARRRKRSSKVRSQNVVSVGVLV